MPLLVVGSVSNRETLGLHLVRASTTVVDMMCDTFGRDRYLPGDDRQRVKSLIT